jgi:hypothetical protein
MASSLDKVFAPFEGTRSAYPIAIFRIAFFTGLALHFFPSLLWLGDTYAPGVLRTEEWSHWLFARFWKIPLGGLRAMAIASILGCILGIVGFRPRVAAIICGAGFYAFASFNGLHLHTLALVNAWALLLLFALLGGGSRVLSADATLQRARSRDSHNPPREPKLLSALVLYQTLLAVFFSGLEKILAGWPGTNEMGILLSYPKGFVVREWVVSMPAFHSSGVTTMLTWFTVIIELGTPILILFKKTRVVALIAYEIFFLGIITMLEVPPLFYCMFAFGALLALDDEQVDAIAAWLRRSRGQHSRPLSSR